MMTVNEAMLAVAKKLASQWGYIEESLFDINAFGHSFWGNHIIGAEAYVKNLPPVIVNACRYIYPVFDFEKDAGKITPKIEIDMYFGKPRLAVRMRDDTFACLTYKDGVFSEGQAFRDKGPELLMKLKNLIDILIKE